MNLLLASYSFLLNILDLDEGGIAFFRNVCDRILTTQLYIREDSVLYFSFVFSYQFFDFNIKVIYVWNLFTSQLKLKCYNESLSIPDWPVVIAWLAWSINLESVTLFLKKDDCKMWKRILEFELSTSISMGITVGRRPTERLYSLYALFAQISYRFCLRPALWSVYIFFESFWSFLFEFVADISTTNKLLLTSVL